MKRPRHFQRGRFGGSAFVPTEGLPHGLAGILLHLLFGGPYGRVFGVFGLALGLEPALGIYGGAAAVARRRDGLAVALVGDVARGEDAGDVRHGVLLLRDVAARVR